MGSALDESFQFAMDWDLRLRLREAGARFVRLPRFLGAFCVHGQTKTVTQSATRGLTEMNRLRLRTFGRAVTRAEIHRGTLAYAARQAVFHRCYQLGFLRN